MNIRAKIGSQWKPIAVELLKVERDTAQVHVPALNEHWLIWQHGLLANLTPRSGICPTLNPADCQAILAAPLN